MKRVTNLGIWGRMGVMTKSEQCNNIKQQTELNEEKPSLRWVELQGHQTESTDGQW